MIAALDVIGQTIGRVIGNCDSLLLCIKGHDRHDGAKDFFAVDAGCVVHICKDRWADIKAAVQPFRATKPAGDHCGAIFFDTHFDQGLDFVELHLTDHGTDVIALLRRGANLGRCGCGCGLLQGLCIARPLHQHTGWGVTRLAGIAHAAGDAIGHRIFSSIGKNDICTFSTKFEAHTFERIGSGFRNGDTCAR